tara:strand:+ start:65 stop:235 length:171 start_codon:yes stop_codon:yes gene_type:complete
MFDMDLGEALEYDYKVSRKEAEFEVKNHGASFEEFIEKYGDDEEFSSRLVLQWLGY